MKKQKNKWPFIYFRHKNFYYIFHHHAANAVINENIPRKKTWNMFKLIALNVYLPLLLYRCKKKERSIFMIFYILFQHQHQYWWYIGWIDCIKVLLIFQCHIVWHYLDTNGSKYLSVSEMEQKYQYKIDVTVSIRYFLCTDDFVLIF